MTSRPTWLPDAASGLVVAAFGVWEAFYDYPETSVPTALTMVLLIAAAVALYRLAPGLALLLVWVAGSVQLLSGAGVMYTELAIVIVAYGCARYGSTSVVWASGLSIPAAAFIAAGHAVSAGGELIRTFGKPFSDAFGVPYYAGSVVFGLVGLGLLAVPWLAGLVFRVRLQAEASRQQQFLAEASRDQAKEIAELRSEQTRLANDVHDVVGHSLAVILAQAESAQFLPDDDPDRIRETMANIATSARQSLQDVRHVLQGDHAAKTGGLDELVAGVKTAGHDVHSTEVGTPRPLAPEIETVAYRSLQEMLTNAMKHGSAGTPISVVRHWSEELTIAVHNRTDADELTEGGLGLTGMRTRLQSVGGRLETTCVDGEFRATAWLPTRPVML